MLPSFQLGFAGVLGSGKQWLSWVHIDDVTGIYCMALDGASGIFNATAPHPGDQPEFTNTLATYSTVRHSRKFRALRCE